MSLAQQLIEQEESCELTAYWDPIGHCWTIGWGHTGPEVHEGLVWTQAQADDALTLDMVEAVDIAKRFPYFSTLPEPRQAALVSMAYQMGTKPLRWPNFTQALADQDYAAAAAAGLDSDWARTETPERAKREMGLLASGEWGSA